MWKPAKLICTECEGDCHVLCAVSSTQLYKWSVETGWSEGPPEALEWVQPSSKLEFLLETGRGFDGAVRYL